VATKGKTGEDQWCEWRQPQGQSCTLLQLRFGQLAAKLAQFPGLQIGRGSSHHMAEQAADDVRLIGFEFERIYQAASESGKGISVEITERRKSMAFATQLRCLIQKHLAAVITLPELPCAVVTIARGFVERFFRLA
jgi:hypothetical protein